MLRTFLLLLLFFFHCLHSQTDLDKPPPKEKKQSGILGKFGQNPDVDPKKIPLYMDAGALEERHTDKEYTFIATQGVHLWQELEDKIGPESVIMDLKCDQAVIWFAQNKDGKKSKNQDAQFYAEGNVHFRWENKTLHGDKVFFDLKRNRGMVINGALRGLMAIQGRQTPLHLRAKKIALLSKEKAQAYQAQITTCDFGDPHYHFSVDYLEILRVRKGSYVRARENKLYAGNIPVFYLPYLAGETDHNWPLKSVKYGNSSKFGHHLLTTWGGTLYENTSNDPGPKLNEVNWLLDLDIREKRGFAIGPGLSYEGELPQRSFFSGKLLTYFINDYPIDFGRGKDKEEDNIGELGEPTFSNIYRIYYLHRHNLPDQWKLDIELSRIDDRNLLFDFFEKEARDEKEQETYIHLKKIWDNQGATFLASTRLNDFQDQVTHLPRGTYNLVQQPLWIGDFGALYFSSNIELTNIRRDDDEDNLSQFDGERIFRADWNNTLSYRLTLGPIFVLPFVTGRLTYFQENVDKENNEIRGVNTTGVDISTNFYRLFYYKNAFLQINNLLHVITPQIGFIKTIVSDDSDELIPFDQVEAIDDAEQVRFRLINRFKTIRSQGTSPFYHTHDKQIVVNRERDIFLFEAELSYLTDRNDLDFKDRFSNLEMDLTWEIRDNLSISLNTEYNFSFTDFEVTSFVVRYLPFPELDMTFDIRHQRSVNVLTSAFATYHIGPKWSLTGNVQYGFGDDDDDNNGFRQQSLVIRRVFHRFALDLEFVRDEIDDNVAFNVAFFPLDFTTANVGFGQ